MGNRVGNRTRSPAEFEMIVGAVIISQRRVVGVWSPNDGRAARPATHQRGSELPGSHALGRIVGDKLVELCHILAQPANDQVRTILRPSRSGRTSSRAAVSERVRAGLVDAPLLFGGLRTLAGIAEYELTGPQHVLARLSLIGILILLRILSQREDIVRIGRNPAADAGLADAVQKSKMLVAGKGSRQSVAVLLVNHRDATRRETIRPGSAGIDRIL